MADRTAVTSGYYEPKAGDHVIMYCRDPRDRLVSAWKWFAGPYNSYIPDILRVSPVDHKFILDRNSPFNEWVQTALRHWNAHWAPQTEIHPDWRTFELRDLATYTGSHQKKTRPDNRWDEFYDPKTLALVNEVYSEDIEMWKEVTSNERTDN